MKEYLDLNNLNSLQEQFLQRVRQNLVNSFTMPQDLQSTLAALNFAECSLSPDFFCEYFSALINKQFSLNIDVNDLQVANSQPIDIQVITPDNSSADRYVASNKMMQTEEMHFAIPEEPEIQASKSLLNKALLLLQNSSASGLQANLLNSIALYSGTYPIPTSASIIFCQGRAYILNVGDSYSLFYYLDMLVHETAHQHLNIINFLAPLSNNTTQTFLSLANNQQRPVYGILHGAFVLYRLIEFYQAEQAMLQSVEDEAVTEEPTDYLQARFFQIPCVYSLRIEVYRHKLKKALQQLLGSGSLTPNGEELVRLMGKNTFMQ